MIRVMFVCLGNICRSPMAEAILRHRIRKEGLAIETASCGTAGYHVGGPPDHRTVEVLKSNDIEINHKAMQLKKSDFNNFDFLVVMDDSNMANVLDVAPSNCHAKILKMRDFDPVEQGVDVNDPWYGDYSDFEICFETLERSIDLFLSSILSDTP